LLTTATPEEEEGKEKQELLLKKQKTESGKKGLSLKKIAPLVLAGGGITGREKERVKKRRGNQD